jgi:hypothetical protein
MINSGSGGDGLFAVTADLERWMVEAGEHHKQHFVFYTHIGNIMRFRTNRLPGCFHYSLFSFHPVPSSALHSGFLPPAARPASPSLQKNKNIDTETALRCWHMLHP